MKIWIDKKNIFVDRDLFTQIFLNSVEEVIFSRTYFSNGRKLVNVSFISKKGTIEISASGLLEVYNY